MTTIDYYNQNADEYAAKTFNADVADARRRFTALLAPGAHILDAGCGSGRDSVAFLGDGFRVTAVEPAANLAAIAARNTGLEILPLTFQQFEFTKTFDAIWACASLLHVPREELKQVFTRLHHALRPNGLLYASFKSIPTDLTENHRHFTAVTLEMIAELALGFTILESWQSSDVIGRADVEWLNIILRSRLQ